MDIKKAGRKPRNGAAFKKIEEAGENEVVILNEEWKLKTPPGKFLLRNYTHKEYSVNTLLDDSGWVIRLIP